MEKREKMLALHKKWEKKCACELRNSATQAVFGDGNPESEIVFIGEAPGKDEDIQGRPFVGRSGKFLEDMLQTIGMKREDIYITNVVKYRPPNNRDPEPLEISTCADWLREELTLISPLLIIFLGRHALNRFFPDAKISEVHGKLLVKNKLDGKKQNFFALYHPASALYNGGMRQTLMDDFKKIPLALKKIKTK